MRKDRYFHREFRRRTLLLPLLLASVGLAFADPAVLLETTRLTPAQSAPVTGYGRSVAIDGDVAVMGATEALLDNLSLFQP